MPNYQLISKVFYRKIFDNILPSLYNPTKCRIKIKVNVVHKIKYNEGDITNDLNNSDISSWLIF